MLRLNGSARTWFDAQEDARNRLALEYQAQKCTCRYGFRHRKHSEDCPVHGARKLVVEPELQEYIDGERELDDAEAAIDRRLLLGEEGRRVEAEQRKVRDEAAKQYAARVESEEQNRIIFDELSEAERDRIARDNATTPEQQRALFVID